MRDALDIIEGRESGGRNIYQQLVPRDVSSASGHFQMIKPTWQSWARAVGIDTNKYPEAINAPYELQRQAAAYGFRTQGFKPWLATKGLVGQEGQYSANPAGGMLTTNPSGVSGETLGDLKARYQTMYNAMPAELRAGLSIGSGYRSPERQAQLWAEALKKYGSPEVARKWVAPPGRSQHGMGNAYDLKYASPAVREWVHANAGKYGLRFPMAHEPWHIETAEARGGGGGATPVTPDARVTAAAAPPPLVAAAPPETFATGFQKGFEQASAPAQPQAPAPAPLAPLAQAEPEAANGGAANLMASLLESKRPRGLLSGWGS